MAQRHEKPLKRVNPSGEVRYVARWTNRDGVRRSQGTFALRREAQAAIDAAYAAEDAGPSIDSTTVGGYYDHEWLQRHPRSTRTEACYTTRMRAVLDVRIDKQPLRDWPMSELRRRHAADLVDVLLRKQGRAASGAQGILRVLSAMFEDAVSDERSEANPFRGVRVKASDRRVQKARRRISVWSWEEMHAFARAAAGSGEMPDYERLRMPGPLPQMWAERWQARAAWRAVYAEPMVRVLSDCGLRIGELFPLERADYDGDTLEVRRTAWRGSVQEGTKTDHGEADAGRTVPVAPDLRAMLDGLPPRIDTRLLFPDPNGRLWSDRLFYDDLWYPARERSGLRITPHEMRHSWISELRAAGVDAADLAAMAGHSPDTAAKHYTHALGRSMDAVRAAVGS
jgi:integrase